MLALSTRVGDDIAHRIDRATHNEVGRHVLGINDPGGQDVELIGAIGAGDAEDAEAGA